jgi:hypothetical protein
MLSERSRLLVMLVLLSVVATAGWTTALASGRTGSATVSSSLASMAKPPAVPNSGEPDVGQTPRSAVTHGSMTVAQRDEGGNSHGPHTDRWLRRLFRMWTIRYLGAR